MKLQMKTSKKQQKKIAAEEAIQVGVLLEGPDDEGLHRRPHGPVRHEVREARGEAREGRSA